ncbi:hypothetical protein MJO29_016133 [Puccinia striiformis f. sp. tritici]|nr:hypothetical protein MJO29_016133 [Puccinia striiformis f. sp. tritici]
MAVRRVVEPACPSSWWAEPSARASKSDLSSDTHVREVLGQASPRTYNQIDSDDSVDTPGHYSDANLDDSSDANMSMSTANSPHGAMFPPSAFYLSKVEDAGLRLCYPFHD